ncbi:T9SS type A sorting domain-containing protein [Algibacter miyuki]|uniref:T9SS type A sorting domain-containing protein n=1 Tax=Algibacter miyuki TaxID=1306933 RepID=A0ABV5GWN9_9FLAO|nr:T9SS type A sorting domain-containing protein [Algibacter miyuki]MDN3664307.1 T9SS type A sorting domain-containing protein [Algibacter miyuki]
MKTLTTTLALVLLTFIGHAQTTLIPDPNFEQALIDLDYDVAPINGSVPTEYINFISALDLTDKNITNLAGIEDFTSLTSLECSGNQITDLDLSNNTILSALNCAGNNLSYLNVKNGNNANFINFKTFNNTNLTCIEVDNVAYSTANWISGINSQMSFSEGCGTYVPDDNFEQALIDAGYDSGPLDNYVPTENIKNRTHLNVSSKNIADLTGIEDFTALTSLTCPQNQLTSLDLSHNKALTRLYCSSNMLRSLNITQNKSLTHFRAHENQLTSLDVSNNIDLIELYCGINQLTSLDVSQNTALISLVVYENQISSLDVSSNTALNELACYNNQLTALNVKNGNNTNFIFFYATDNPNLTCIEVDDATYSSTNWTDIDAQASFNESCSVVPLTYVPDDNFEQALISLGFDSGPLDDYVPTENINTITTLDVSVRNITDLTGIEDFVALKVLICAYNELTTLDLSKNIALTDLYAHNNLLTTLDASQNQFLSFFYVNINQLTSLKIKNGNNTIITEFVTTDNPELTCIEVDDATYSTTNWTDIDAQASFNESCSVVPLTYVPDDNFEQALIDLGYDTGALDDYVPTDNINTVTTLDVSNKNIADLTGIEDFIILEELYCNNNQITSINIENNSALTILNINFNLISSLDVSNNLSLTSLLFTYNEVSNINLSNNELLTDLYCSGNNLTSLDVSNNLALKKLSCPVNEISDLDVSKNNVLTRLNVHFNKLTSLNVKNNNNLNFIEFLASSNDNLTCIEVDDAAYSTSHWSGKDAHANFSENCIVTPLTYVPDDNFEQALISLGFDSGPLNDYVPTENIDGITTLSISFKDISDLTGIEDFEALSVLLCYSNQLTSLNLTNNTNLTNVNVGGNNLLYLNVKNGANTNITTFITVENVNLLCIEVDDETFSTLHWSETIDSQSSFSESCQYLSTNDFKETDFKIYPNPADSYIHIESASMVTNVSIYNVLGQDVLHTQETDRINISALRSGTYFIRIKSNTGEQVKKIIKI